MRLQHKTLLLAALLACGAAAGEGPASLDRPIGRDEVQAAVGKLRSDPNLGGEKTIRSLRWSFRPSDSAPPQRTPPWIVGLFEFLGQSASVLLWVAGAGGAAVAAIWVIRTLRSHSPSPKLPPEPGLLNVRQHDIRPASLPDDVGAAALQLLDAGRTRDALSLLYRGALSRAVHRHGVVIGESYTEGEALEAVKGRFDPPRAAYFSDLVAIWQRAVYAGEAAAPEPIARLCERFSPALDEPGR